MGKKLKPLTPPYFKIRLKGLREKNWTDDYNTPDPRNPNLTKRFKTLPAAKRSLGKTTWGIPHTKKIVQVTRSGTKTVHTSKRIFSKMKRK